MGNYITDMNRNLHHSHGSDMDDEFDDDDHESYDAHVVDGGGFHFTGYIENDRAMANVLQHIVSGSNLMNRNNQLSHRLECKPRMPTIKRKENLDKLKENPIYENIRYDTGYGKNGINEKWSVVDMINKRQNGLGDQYGAFRKSEQCKIFNSLLPNHAEVLEELRVKVFTGSFSKHGKYFISASQDHIIRVYDASKNTYKNINTMLAREVSWSILDIAFSPDDQQFVYSTWSECLHLSKVNGKADELQCLNLQPGKPKFCVFSVAFTNCGRKIVCAASDSCLYIYDKGVNRRTVRIPTTLGRECDVNTVCFTDETTNIACSGADDDLIKVWDLRCINESNPVPIGVFIGHFDGITFIDSKNDSRYILSNSKDQSIKLWDLRKFSDMNAIRERVYLRDFKWDYRWDEVPKEFYNPKAPLDGDTSIMTYRGHRVNKSLIRARFSPIATTGQRYIYTGCGTGRLIIYDILTGNMVSQLHGHGDIVRDVAWHPYRPEILTSSWDYNININTYKEKISQSSRKSSKNLRPIRRSQRLAKRRLNDD